MNTPYKCHGCGDLVPKRYEACPNCDFRQNMSVIIEFFVDVKASYSWICADLKKDGNHEAALQVQAASSTLQGAIELIKNKENSK